MTHDSNQAIANVPTNIITGFLGTGKTSLILHLLKSKPKNENWAVLVNEFGDIGIDGRFIASQGSKTSGIYVKEVPGGCMCCAAGISMQVALNQLLVESKPDRLLIEPTGLGHPLEVMEVLSSGYYQNILSINKIITLVDARKITDSRYTSNATFNQQIDIADIIVGNKKDLYGVEDENNLFNYLKLNLKSKSELIFTEQGNINIELLNGKTGLFLDNKIKGRKLNNGSIKDKTYSSFSCSFDSYKVFNRQKLISFFQSNRFDRLKGIFITNAGIYGYNIADDCINELELDETMESQIEIISATKIENDWRAEILKCI